MFNTLQKIFSVFGNIHFLNEGEAPDINVSDLGTSTGTTLLDRPGRNKIENIKTHPVETDPKPVADMIFATYQDDKIHDIVFQQGGKQISLQEIHPLSMTVEITHHTPDEIGGDHDKEAVAHLGSGLIEINDYQPPGEDFRLRMLHEWGHLVDHAENVETYVPMIRKVNFEKFKQRVIVSRADDIDIGSETDFSQT